MSSEDTELRNTEYDDNNDDKDDDNENVFINPSKNTHDAPSIFDCNIPFVSAFLEEKRTKKRNTRIKEFNVEANLIEDEISKKRIELGTQEVAMRIALHVKDNIEYNIKGDEANNIMCDIEALQDRKRRYNDAAGIFATDNINNRDIELLSKSVNLLSKPNRKKLALAQKGIEQLENKLSKDKENVLGQINKPARSLRKEPASNQVRNTRLENYKENFRKRYESEQSNNNINTTDKVSAASLSLTNNNNNTNKASANNNISINKI
jgi:hypothetical protein